MCTTIKTKHKGCGHIQYQNTSHCHIVRRLLSSPSLHHTKVDEEPVSEYQKAFFPPRQLHQALQELRNRQPSSSSQLSADPSWSPTASPPPYPQVRSRDDHRLLLPSTKWLPDSQPRVPPGMFECAQNVATRPVDGLCRSCQRQQQQARNLTPRPRTTTPVAAGTLSPLPSSSSPQIQSKKKGQAKPLTKDKKREPSSLLSPPATVTTPSTSAAATPVSGNGVRSTSTATAGRLASERSPSRSVTPASMFRRAIGRDRATSAGATSSPDVDLTRVVRDSFQRLSFMYGGSNTPEREKNQSVSAAVSRIPEEEGGNGGGADVGKTETPDKQK